MKILLVGEYSRLHNSLKEGLQHLGHDVFLIGHGDDFKDYPVDFKFEPFFSKGFPKLISNLVYRMFRLNLKSLSFKRQFFKNKELFTCYDIVQLINENPFNNRPKTEISILKHIFNHNTNAFLLSCGIDYLSIKYAYHKKLKYSVLSPLFENENLKKHYKFILEKLSPSYIKLHDYVFKNINGVISSDLDYHIPHLGHNNYLGMVPNPINTKLIQYIPLSVKDNIVIFHGINTSSYIRKGNIFFDMALESIQKKYMENVTVIKTENLPYEEYIKAYDSCHILLDQVYAHDQGYNALEAMARGKVVFTGAEKEWLDYYHLSEDTVGINALPDANLIAKKLEWLIQNPEKIIEISKNARAFIEREHNYITIAQKYLDIWKHN